MNPGMSLARLLVRLGDSVLLETTINNLEQDFGCFNTFDTTIDDHESVTICHTTYHESIKQQHKEAKVSNNTKLRRKIQQLVEDVQEDLALLALCRRPKNGLHLVLDLDSTLIHNESGYDWIFGRELMEEPDFFMLKPPRKTKARPFLQLFLNVCFAVFESVSVWTAGTTEYKEYIISGLRETGILDGNFACEYDRDDCLRFTRDPYVEGPEDTDLCKRLAWLCLEHKHIGMDMSNTFIVDDNTDYSKHNVENFIPIPPWNNDTADDIHLLELASRFLCAQDATGMLRIVAKYWCMQRKEEAKQRPGN